MASLICTGWRVRMLFKDDVYSPGEFFVHSVDLHLE